MDRVPELTLTPIGRIVAGTAGRECAELANEGVLVDVAPAWAEALDGIEEFSHIWIIWWLDRSEGPPETCKVRPERRPEFAPVGLFATRSPQRPNPIAMTAVKLLGREGTRLHIDGIDALPGTPVLDIKPYLRRGDLISDALSPEWLTRLWRLHDDERAREADSG